MRVMDIIKLQLTISIVLFYRIRYMEFTALWVIVPQQE